MSFFIIKDESNLPMKTKLLGLIITAITANTAHAGENLLFQNLDNQIALGYSYNSIQAYNPNYSGPNVTTTSNNLNLHVEQLFNNNVWFAVDGSFAFKASQNSPGGVGFSDNTQEFGFPASISGKAGYSFNWVGSSQGIQIIPYATIGRMLNYNGLAVSQNQFVNSYLNQYGGGARIEYAFSPEASIYFDQSISYLQDPNSSTTGENNQSSMSYTSLLGIKYNVTRYFQLGLQGMFNQLNLINTGTIGYNPITYSYQNTNQTSFGGMINFAYLYNNDQLMSSLFSSSSNISGSHSTANSTLAAFDNNYSIGYGFANSTNRYNGGSNPNIGSSIDYFNFNVSHLFENNVWASLNAQLMNSITQTNVPSGRVNATVPSYVGFPGNVTIDVGYGFQAANSGFQIIPYGNAGVIMNMNSYNIRSNDSIMSAISNDMYLQYGLGGRAEYIVIPQLQLYADQLFAAMQDRSPLNANAWRSTSALGLIYNPWDRLQLGVKGYYDYISPTGSTSNGNGSYYALNQSTLGAEFSIGMRY